MFLNLSKFKMCGLQLLELLQAGEFWSLKSTHLSCQGCETLLWIVMPCNGFVSLCCNTKRIKKNNFLWANEMYSMSCSHPLGSSGGFYCACSKLYSSLPLLLSDDIGILSHFCLFSIFPTDAKPHLHSSTFLPCLFLLLCLSTGIFPGFPSSLFLEGSHRNDAS